MNPKLAVNYLHHLERLSGATKSTDILQENPSADRNLIEKTSIEADMDPELELIQLTSKILTWLISALIKMAESESASHYFIQSKRMDL